MSEQTRSVALGLLLAVLAGVVAVGLHAARREPPRTPTAGTPSTWIRLSPASGPPGTVVAIRGHVPGGPTEADATISERHGTVCWAGCSDGLRQEAVRIRWSATHPGDFETQLVVPRIAWLTPAGPRPLLPGSRYTVGVQCIGPDLVGCAARAAQATAAFRLTGRASDLCLHDRPCGRLRLSPTSGTPGTLVRATGWAPLTEIIGRPTGYMLVVRARNGQPVGSTTLAGIGQTTHGELSGSFTVPMALAGLGAFTPGRYTLALQAFFPFAGPTAMSSASTAIRKGGRTVGVRVDLAPVDFTVTAPLNWASLGSVHPLWVQRSQAWLGSDPSHSQRLVYCGPGGIHLSADGGTSWRTVPTAGVAKAAAATPFSLFDEIGGRPPTCASATLDPAHPASLFATFYAGKKPYGAPPVYLVGYETADGGRTWRPVPTPRGYGPGDFGGFRADHRGADALFGRLVYGARPGGTATASVVQRTTDGGLIWRPAVPTCPQAGPCLRWGPLPSGIGSCAMHAYPQPIQRSADGGRTWSTGIQVNACWLNEIVALSGSDVLLVSGRTPVGLRVSRDGGATWQDVALPPLPGTPRDAMPLWPGLQVLPNGSLLAFAAGPHAQRAMVLAPRARSWCAAGPGMPTMLADDAQVEDGRLWLLARPGPQQSAVSVPLVALRCVGAAG